MKKYKILRTDLNIEQCRENFSDEISFFEETGINGEILNNDFYIKIRAGRWYFKSLYIELRGILKELKNGKVKIGYKIKNKFRIFNMLAIILFAVIYAIGIFIFKSPLDIKNTTPLIVELILVAISEVMLIYKEIKLIKFIKNAFACK